MADKARVVDETHHWIAGDGDIWVAINSGGGIWFTTDWRYAHRCGSELGARGLVARNEVKRDMQTLVSPKKFRAWLLNEKVEVSPCRS